MNCKPNLKGISVTSWNSSGILASCTIGAFATSNTSEFAPFWHYIFEQNESFKAQDNKVYNKLHLFA